MTAVATNKIVGFMYTGGKLCPEDGDSRVVCISCIQRAAAEAGVILTFTFYPATPPPIPPDPLK